ncbi:MAG: NADH-quinone oxidoreductase subunit NuoI [Enterobacteriaceae bacterium]
MINSFLENLFSIAKSIIIVFAQLFKKKETYIYPKKKVKLSYRFRGKIVLTKNKDGTERCVACGLCSSVCPVKCIYLEKGLTKNKKWFAKIFRINFSRCIFCGFCEEACPTMSIQLTPDFEMCEYKKVKLIYEKDDLLVEDCGKNKKYNFYNLTGNYKSNNLKKCVNRKKILP